MAKNGAVILYERIFVRLVLLVCMIAMISVVSFAKEDSTTTGPKQSQLQVSVGDFRIVVRSPSWPWGLPTDPNELRGYYNWLAKSGEPCYLRPPRNVPVHNSMPVLTRHPVTGDIIMRFTPYADSFPEHRMAGICISHDNGWTWSNPVLVKYIDNIGPLKNGWIGISYESGYDPEAPHKPRFLVSRSPDGIEWTPDEKEVIIEFPKHLTPVPLKNKPMRGLYKNASSVVIYKRIIEHNGSLYASGYGDSFKGIYGGVCFLVRSDDDGKSWQFVSAIGKDYEPDYCIVGPNEWISVQRSDTSREPRPLMQSRSLDDGITWEDAVPAVGVDLVKKEEREWRTANGELFAACDGANVDPALLRLGNGIVALSCGRPGLHLYFSIDGKGKRWSHKTTILPKYGRTDGKPWVFPEASEYSHNYSSMAAISDRTLLLASNIYGYSPSGDKHKGRDVCFVVPVSVRKPDDPANRPPSITGPGDVTIQPGRKLQVKFDLSDPDGDWIKLICAGSEDIKIEGNTLTWQTPWEFKGSKKIKVIAEDAWGLRSKEHILTIRSDEKDK